MQKIVFFDGVCSLCNFAVDFIIKRNPQKNLKIASLQGKTAKSLLDQSERESLASLVFYDEGKVYRFSSAALRICQYLSLPWRMATIFLILPPFIRDLLYKTIAKYRYKIFGKRDLCRIPTEEEKKFFLD